jgi:hypothetical protein
VFCDTKDWGDIIPSIRIELGEGEVADQIRRNASAWSVCISIDSEFHSCSSLLKPEEVPRMDLDTRIGVHVLRAWLGNSANGRGIQDPGSISVVSRFTTHASMLGILTVVEIIP